MEKVIILKEHEAKEIGVFLGKLLAEAQKDKVRGFEPNVNIGLLEHYKRFLWGN